MLCLTRKRFEEVIITTPEGRTIRVSITLIRGDKVRLGFTTDRAVEVHRAEIHDAIHGVKANLTVAEPEAGAAFDDRVLCEVIDCEPQPFEWIKSFPEDQS